MSTHTYEEYVPVSELQSWVVSNAPYHADPLDSVISFVAIGVPDEASSNQKLRSGLAVCRTQLHETKKQLQETKKQLHEKDTALREARKTEL